MMRVTVEVLSVVLGCAGALALAAGFVLDLFVGEAS